MQHEKCHSSRTNKKDQSIRRTLGICRTVHRDQLHARDNRADKVDVEYGVNVDQVKDDRSGQEA